MRTAFLALGVKGEAMAEQRARAGHQVVYNRAREKTERWIAESGRRLGHLRMEASANAELAKAGRDDDVRAITARTDSALATLGKHPVLVLHTSTFAKHARKWALFAEISLARRIEALAEALILPEQQGSISKPFWISYPYRRPGPGKRTTGTRACWSNCQRAFAMVWMREKLGICIDGAQHNGASLPAARPSEGFYAEIEAIGGRSRDTSCLLARL